ncbi:MAG: hypothetical protein HC853_03770 [Anaerolineae bacterium]|nr:hypothetical protein [Anaerolineae bacterium]
MSDLNYPLTLALQNYMPVVLAMLGMVWIAQSITSADRAVGLLAPGFTFVAWAVWQMRRAHPIPNTRRIWLAPVFMACAAGLSSGALALLLPSRAWAFVLIGCVTAASTALAMLLAAQARGQGINIAAVLFLVNLLMNFSLGLGIH